MAPPSKSTNPITMKPKGCGSTNIIICTSVNLVHNAQVCYFKKKKKERKIKAQEKSESKGKKKNMIRKRFKGKKKKKILTK